jgi:hypothetical protein
MQPVSSAGVTPMMKRAAVPVALGVIVACIWYLQRPHPTTAAPDLPPPKLTREAAPSTTGSAAAAASTGIAKVEKLASPEARKALAERIATAQSARGAVRAPPHPTLPDPGTAPAQMLTKVEIRSAMKEVIPYLTECYEAAIPTLSDRHVELTAKLKLTGDPDIGTVIDADALVDKDGKPLPAAFDDCLRSTFMMLALPPLAEGNVIDVHYPFVFSSEP